MKIFKGQRWLIKDTDDNLFVVEACNLPSIINELYGKIITDISGGFRRWGSNELCWHGVMLGDKFEYDNWHFTLLKGQEAIEI